MRRRHCWSKFSIFSQSRWISILPAEVHDSRQERLRVQEAIEHLFKPEAFAAIDVHPLVPSDEVISNLLLPLAQELGIGNAVREEEEWEGG